jgi:formylglycine-generating enzyme required for sulfatase activity
LQNGVVIADKTTQREFVLTAAPGEIIVREKDGVQLATRKFELARGGTSRVRVTLAELADARQPAGEAQSGWPKGFTNSVGMKFVLVPRGKFLMGGGNGDVGTNEVDVGRDFYIAVYEVTQKEWELVTGSNPSYFSRTGEGKDAVRSITDAELSRFPVEQVSWNNAQLFLKVLNEREKATGRVYRFPRAPSGNTPAGAGS